jgi:hypothetical protein
MRVHCLPLLLKIKVVRPCAETNKQSLGPIIMSEKGYNTNLASDFYGLSVLYRLGTDAVLPLNNKKSMYIAVVRDASDSA